MIRVFDTGALIGIERRDQRILAVHRRAVLEQSLVDAIVMATAARLRRSGDVVVYRSDFDDLSRLQAHLPGVRLLHVAQQA